MIAPTMEPGLWLFVAVAALVILVQFATGRVVNRGWRVVATRAENPFGFWVSISMQIALLAVIIYCFANFGR